MASLDADSIDFVVTSPPYWNILHKEDHKAKQERKDHDLDTRYSDDPRDLGNVKDYPAFLDELTGILGQCGRVLKRKKYMAVVVSDFRDKSKFIMFHADLATALRHEGAHRRQAWSRPYPRQFAAHGMLLQMRSGSCHRRRHGQV